MLIFVYSQFYIFAQCTTLANTFRFAVASKDIKIGTTIMRDTPIASVLDQDQFGTHCQHCFATIRGVIPCLKCTWVCFCSVECREAASRSYHQYECGILKLLLESGLNCFPYLALRSVCTEGLESLLNMKQDLTSDRNEAAGTTKDLEARAEAAEAERVYLSSDFRNLYNLTAHEDSITNDQWIIRTLVAVFLLKCLKLTTFFDQSQSAILDDCQLTENELFIGTVLLRLLNIFPCNVHDIAEFENPFKDHFAKGAQKVSLGSAVYPSLALLNHSCDPSFMRCNKGNISSARGLLHSSKCSITFSGNQVICVTSRNIKAGEEICENYGLMYTAKSRDERQKVLKDHYKFDCCCEPCSKNWPLLVDMKNILGNNNSKEAVDLLTHGKWKQGLAKADQLFEKVLQKSNMPLPEVAETQIAIWKCLWLKYGNTKQVKML